MFVNDDLVLSDMLMNNSLSWISINLVVPFSFTDLSPFCYFGIFSIALILVCIHFTFLISSYLCQLLVPPAPILFEGTSCFSFIGLPWNLTSVPGTSILICFGLMSVECYLNLDIQSDFIVLPITLNSHLIN